MNVKAAIRRVLTVTTVAVTLLVGAQVSASAHSGGRTLNGSGWPYHHYGYVFWSSDHKTIRICDENADGVGVWVEFYVRHIGSDDQYRTLSDGNGSASPCGSWTAPGSDYIVLANGHSRDGNSTTGWFNP